MARLIKDWLRAKKGICTSDCQCLTIAGWKCYAEENLCNCGYKKESAIEVPASVPVVNPGPVIEENNLEENNTNEDNTEEPDVIDLNELNS